MLSEEEYKEVTSRAGDVTQGEVGGLLLELLYIGMLNVCRIFVAMCYIMTVTIVL